MTILVETVTKLIVAILLKRYVVLKMVTLLYDIYSFYQILILEGVFHVKQLILASPKKLQPFHSKYSVKFPSVKTAAKLIDRKNDKKQLNKLVIAAELKLQEPTAESIVWRIIKLRCWLLFLLYEN